MNKQQYRIITIWEENSSNGRSGYIPEKGMTVAPIDKFAEPYLNPITPKSSDVILQK